MEFMDAGTMKTRETPERIVGEDFLETITRGHSGYLEKKRTPTLYYILKLLLILL